MSRAWLYVRLVAAILALYAITLAGVVLVASALARFERRMPRLSGALAATTTVVLLFWLLRAVHRRRRLMAQIKAKALALDCPYCGGRLPPWNGAFRSNPDEPDCVDWIDMPPLGAFRLHCERCQRDVWFHAWRDVAVTHIDWKGV